MLCGLCRQGALWGLNAHEFAHDIIGNKDGLLADGEMIVGDYHLLSADEWFCDAENAAGFGFAKSVGEVREVDSFRGAQAREDVFVDALLGR
jgi:hypothetical protein